MSDLTKIIALAAKHPNIVAIGTEGSGNNPALAPDPWTDLDVTLFAAAPARENGADWVHALGDPTLIQHLSAESPLGSDTGSWESWLTRYPGTRRIDLKLAPAEAEAAYLAADRLNAIVWRAGTGRLTPRQTSAASHFLPCPSQATYEATVNELVWIAGNVVKGLARGNLLYANEQFNQHLRPQLIQLLAVRETIKAQGQFDPGVNGKNVWPQLSTAARQQLAATYQQTTIQETRTSLQQALSLAEQLVTDFTQAHTFAQPSWLPRALTQLHTWLGDDDLFR